MPQRARARAPRKRCAAAAGCARGEDLAEAGEEIEVRTTGRHDPCVGIRAVPVGEAMVAVVLADHVLRHRAQCG